MRLHKYFKCDKCGKTNPDYLTFKADMYFYCLDHIPLRWRISLWLMERWDQWRGR